ncbi:uncharacterized protein LOC105841627 [Bombyx mori]|uniref:uncharacterized protein LOC105841627 n=1 Tax=Bombyx mori TaxID=7091 RepID=UPI002ED1E942
MLRRIIIFVFVVTVSCSYVNKLQKEPYKFQFYPKKTVFEKSDLIDKGCAIFITQCPNNYKQTLICARHYDGQYKTFNNYCEMEFENCNSWRKWSMVKRNPC